MSERWVKRYYRDDGDTLPGVWLITIEKDGAPANPIAECVDEEDADRIIADHAENALLTARLVAATGLLEDAAERLALVILSFGSDDNLLLQRDVRDRLVAYLAAERPEQALLEDLRAAYDALRTHDCGGDGPCIARDALAALKRWLPEAAS